MKVIDTDSTPCRACVFVCVCVAVSVCVCVAVPEFPLVLPIIFGACGLPVVPEFAAGGTCRKNLGFTKIAREPIEDFRCRAMKN